MKYYLFLWITGCIGFGCPVPDYEEQAFDDLGACEKALDVSMRVAELSKKRYAGICLPEDAVKRIKQEWELEE